MFRGPQILTWSCPKWSLLLLRESHLPPICEHTGAVWQGARHVKGRRYDEIPGKGRSKEESSLSTETVSFSTQLSVLRLDCNNHGLKEALFQKPLSKAILSRHHQPPQISAPLKAEQVSKFFLERNVGQNSKVVKTCCESLMYTTCLQPWRRPWDFCQPLLSFISKTQCNLLQSHLHYRQQSIRSFSLAAHTPWILNHFHSRPQPSSFSPQQIRTINQAAPCVVDAWRDCLSPENENRCRQILGPNLKLYEVEKVKKGASQSQGTNQGRWASILVSLCSVEGEPVFLFTLRSSTLKGRHKGDVRLVAG